MTTATLQKEYQNLIKRQKRIEKDFEVLKRFVFTEIDEAHIQPTMLQRWDKISHNLDLQKGHFFASRKEVKQWLDNL